MNNWEVAQAWGHSEGRNGHTGMSWKGAELMSGGTIVARRYAKRKRVLVLALAGTQRKLWYRTQLPQPRGMHRDHAWYCHHKAAVMEVPRVVADSAEAHRVNVMWLMEAAAQELRWAERARVHWESHLTKRREWLEHCAAYCAWFGVPMPEVPKLSEKLTVKAGLRKLSA